MEVPFLGWEDCACRNIEPQVHTNQVSVQLVPRPGIPDLCNKAYRVQEVRGTDALQGTIKYRARALPEDEPLLIRNNTLDP